MLEITKGIYITDLSLYLKNEKTLIISDLHLGYEEVLNKQGILVPRFHLSDLLKKLENIFLDLEWNKCEVERIIINGDLKHEFGSVSKQEQKDTKKVLELLSKKTKNIILIEGNHDKTSKFILQKYGIGMKKFEYFESDKIFVCHGDEIIKNDSFKKSKIVVISHEHPAVRIREESKAETYKCFLLGKYKDKQLIVLPSMNLLTEGTDVLKEELLSPFLDDVSDFECFVVSDRVYGFGKVKKLSE